MKPFKRNQARPSGGPGAPVSAPARRSLRRLICVWLLGFGMVAQAADTNSPSLSPQDYFEGGPNTYNNWITLSSGGLLTHGNPAQAAESLHLGTGPFGGIEDLHIQGNAFTKIGRASGRVRV